MEKYTGLIDDKNSSHYKILKKIKVNSKILECGSASGYVTEYLTNELHCAVDIIEIDKDSFKKARKFSRNAFNIDLNDGNWVKRLRKEKYDYILFMDVLEHLNNPGEVLEKSSNLLKDDGTILVTLPNCCHNDMLLKMYNDSWDYTNTGINDVTHVRYFGYNNILSLFEKSKLFIKEISSTNVKTLCTEQCVSKNINKDLFDVISYRPYGEVYQYIVEATRKQSGELGNVETINNISITKNNQLYDSKHVKACEIYYKLIDGVDSFSLQNKIFYFCKDTNTFEMVLEVPNNVQQIRIDPCSQQCLIYDVELTQNNNILNIDIANAVKYGNYLVFNTSDSQILF
ncbi:MAG: class I SAM-dependent methyltransferase, partial [Bacilli bacterium]|nr:class I SAM-dependent methyltransferase [Bacilli bacterium]